MHREFCQYHIHLKRFHDYPKYYRHVLVSLATKLNHLIYDQSLATHDWQTKAKTTLYWA